MNFNKLISISVSRAHLFIQHTILVGFCFVAAVASSCSHPQKTETAKGKQVLPGDKPKAQKPGKTSQANNVRAGTAVAPATTQSNNTPSRPSTSNVQSSTNSGTSSITPLSIPQTSDGANSGFNQSPLLPIPQTRSRTNSDSNPNQSPLIIGDGINLNDPPLPNTINSDTKPVLEQDLTLLKFNNPPGNQNTNEQARQEFVASIKNYASEKQENTNEQARQKFVTSFIDYASEEKIDLTGCRSGVSLVVLARNNAGEICVVLGKEQGGPYLDKLNFIGGKIDSKPGKSEKENLVETLYDEVREELGIHLACDPFVESLISNEKVRYRTDYTMLFFCYLSDIDTEQWKKMYQERLKKRLDWKYIEMSELAYVPVEELDTSTKECSLFVKQNIQLIKNAAEAIEQKPRTPLSIKDFPKVEDSVPML